ncbi:MAG: nucleotidyltransferase family protein, partial [Alphaproteobacteria bacterium]
MKPSPSDLPHRTANDLLREALITPENLVDLHLSEWDRLVPEARSAGLLARLDVLLRERGIYDTLPAAVKPHLIAFRRIAESEQCAMRWELNRIERALADVGTPIVLLKGAAYLMRQIPNARGRISSDVDILVAKEQLNAVEDRLLKHGWRHIKLEEYDQYFYRKWSHELPPLQHRDRGTVVDVHHTILPPTGRLRPDA